MRIVSPLISQHTLTISKNLKFKSTSKLIIRECTYICIKNSDPKTKKRIYVFQKLKKPKNANLFSIASRMLKSVQYCIKWMRRTVWLAYWVNIGIIANNNIHNKLYEHAYQALIYVDELCNVTLEWNSPLNMILVRSVALR